MDGCAKKRNIIALNNTSFNPKYFFLKNTSFDPKFPPKSTYFAL